MASNSGAKITRRSFVERCIGAAAVASTAVKPISHLHDSLSIASSTRADGVDQNPIRRRGTGLRALDAGRASAGLTLFAPLTGDGTVYLIDFQGRLERQGPMGGTSSESSS